MSRLSIVVIYQDPSDFPGKFVVRRQWAHPGGVEIEAEPLAVVDTLPAAREAVPVQQDWRTPRQPEDDPTIVETWI